MMRQLDEAVVISKRVGCLIIGICCFAVEVFDTHCIPIAEVLEIPKHLFDIAAVVIDMDSEIKAIA